MLFEYLYAADDFWAVRCPFWLKFQEMNGLGRGYLPFEFCQDALRYAGGDGPKTAKNKPKNQFFYFLYNRVRLPGDLIFGLQASFGSYGHWGMREIFDNFFLYQSPFRTVVLS